MRMVHFLGMSGLSTSHRCFMIRLYVSAGLCLFGFSGHLRMAEVSSKSSGFFNCVDNGKRPTKCL
jgi:hypothetical protein